MPFVVCWKRVGSKSCKWQWWQSSSKHNFNNSKHRFHNLRGQEKKNRIVCFFLMAQSRKTKRFFLFQTIPWISHTVVMFFCVKTKHKKNPFILFFFSSFKLQQVHYAKLPPQHTKGLLGSPALWLEARASLDTHSLGSRLSWMGTCRRCRWGRKQGQMLHKWGQLPPCHMSHPKCPWQQLPWERSGQDSKSCGPASRGG